MPGFLKWMSVYRVLETLCKTVSSGIASAEQEAKFVKAQKDLSDHGKACP